MAHLNIDARRDAVHRLMQESLGQNISAKKKKELADRYACSVGAISADMRALAPRVVEGPTVYVSQALRQRILFRDRNTCQYCGERDLRDPLVDHIVPQAKGGHAREYNLACICAKCNGRRIHSPMKPANFQEITSVYPEWRQVVDSFLYDSFARGRPGPKPQIEEPVQIAAIITSEQKQWLEKEAERCQRSVSTLLRHAIDEFIRGRSDKNEKNE